MLLNGGVKGVGSIGANLSPLTFPTGSQTGGKTLGYVWTSKNWVKIYVLVEQQPRFFTAVDQNN